MNEWLLLILSLPTENTSARMRAWRALKASGAAVLRDGVYLIPSGIPAGTERREMLDAVARDVEASGGTAYLLELAQSASYPFAALFDRTPEYSKLADEIASCLTGIDAVAMPDTARQARKFRKAFAALGEIDFFPGETRRQVDALLDELARRIQIRSSPDEPTGTTGTVTRRDPAKFQGRLWATRKRLWVDRMASAWLVRRFIDTAAQFVWLDNPAECPADALGFDFDGATFTHMETPAGVWVSFETLMMSFGFETDAALKRIARIVHYLDVGGLPVPEAAGLESLLRGMRARIDNDDTLLIETGHLFDDFYRAFQEETKQS
ncbi:MAG: chromate resistance protein [Gammaproteobacteria bacterium]|nr:chromate resistance protein [Gammaproteobacteria bacterium]